MMIASMFLPGRAMEIGMGARQVHLSPVAIGSGAYLAAAGQF